MKTSIIFATVLLAATTCNAQDSAAYRTCSNKASTQRDMNACANEEAKRVDDKLNDLYKLLLSKVRDHPLAASKIKIAQKAWIACRDAYIEAMYPAKDKQGEYGSIYPMEVALLTARLTRQQVVAMQEIFQRNDSR